MSGPLPKLTEFGHHSSLNHACNVHVPTLPSPPTSQALVKNLLAGNYEPVILRGVLFGDAGKGNSLALSFIYWPAIIIDADGARHWGMVHQVGNS